MSIVNSIIMYILWLVIVPFLMGIIPGFIFEKSKKRIGTIYLSGWIFMTAIFQLVSVPMIIKMKFFSELETVYTIVLAALAILSAVILIIRVGTNSFIDFVELPQIKKLDKNQLIGWAVFAVLILFQIAMSIAIATPDGDDSYYVTHSVMAVEKDTMYMINSYTGIYNNLEYRHILAPLSMLVAFFAKKVNVHAAIMAHTLLPPVLIILTYLIYYKICQALYPTENEKQPLFMIILAGIQIFGGASVYTNEMFFLTRTWQGKSMLANIVIPFVFYLTLQLCRQTEKEEYHRYRISGIMILMFMANLSGALMSSLGLLLLMIFECAMYVLIAFRNKKMSLMLAGAPTLIPCMVYMLLYVLLK